jgi:MFS transporter, ACS family, tartrate transporter
MFVKRLSGASITGVTSLLMLPALLGLAGTLANGWHSDKTGERRWHAAAPLLAAAAMYGCVLLFRADVPVAVACLLLGSGFLYAFYPVFWSLPTLILSDTAAAASFGLIVSLSQIGGIIGPYVIGYLNEATHSLSPGLGFIAALYLAAAGLVIGVRIQQPARAAAAIADTD